MTDFRRLLINAVFIAAFGGVAAAQPAAPNAAPPPPPFHLTSPAFEDTGILPNRHTQVDGPTSPSPALNWSGAPAGAQSFTLLMHDMEPAPNRGSMDNTHWLIFNIPANATALPEGVARDANLPDGSVQIARGTAVGYGPPGAPPGLYHHYAFELFALDAKLTLGPTATRPEVIAAMDGHVLGKAVLIGRFHR